MSAPRFQTQSVFLTIFADKVRLATDDDLGRFFVKLVPSPEMLGQYGAPVELDLPLKDRAAYERAAAAFNAIMDEHDKLEAAKNERRRARRASASASPLHQAGA